VTSAPVTSSSPGTRIAIVRDLGLVDYTRVWQDMCEFTNQRDASTQDEIWLVEHPPIYTLGTNDRNEAFENPGIPVVKSDRGGQITYHGPGQLIVYILMDLRRHGWGVKQLVMALEQSVIDLLAARGLSAVRHAGAPGVYVDGCKIAQLGLRVRRGASYHGLSLNVDMDHEPFRRIKPCGFSGLKTTDLAALAGRESVHLPEIKIELLDRILPNLGYNLRQAI